MGDEATHDAPREERVRSAHGGSAHGGSAQGSAHIVRTPHFPEVVRELYRFEVLGQLDEGGMAEVFLVREREAPFRQAVLKRIHASAAGDAEVRAMFLDEARLAMRLSHPSLCAVYDAGMVGEQPCLAMEWVDGVTLEALIERAGPTGLPIELCAYIAARVASALDSVHRARDERGRLLGIVHRDVTPANVMISFDGEVKLLDFGLAKSCASQVVTRPGCAKGKLGYLAPEVWKGEPATAASDVFSLGVCLHEALAGRPLYAYARARDTQQAIVESGVPSARAARAGVPRELDAVLARCLAKHPCDRFSSAGALEAALDQLLLTNDDPQSQLRTLVRQRFAAERSRGPALMPSELERIVASVPPPPPVALTSSLPPPPRRSAGARGRTERPPGPSLLGPALAAVLAISAAIALALAAVHGPRVPASRASVGPTRVAGDRPVSTR